MEVRVLNSLPGNDCPDRDYIRVHACSAPEDDTVILATIERITDRTTASRTTKRVRTLLGRRPMSIDAALELATSYAERKQVPIVYAEPVAPGR